MTILAAIAVTGVLFAKGQQIPGTIFQTDDGPGSCTGAQDTACYEACDNTITNPFCSVLSGGCVPTGGGGTTCVCSIFCVTTQGGVKHRPDEPFYPKAMYVGSEDDPR